MRKQFFNNRFLLLILFLGLVVRLLFIFFGSTYFHGAGKEFTNNDTFSYTNSFLNLYTKGVYSFDLTHPDAYFGRLPGYPLFWGLHYIVWGPELAFVGVAISQGILDTLAIFFIYNIALVLSKNRTAALLTSFIYAFYPFIIVWVPITLTELFATFLTTFFFYWLFCKENTLLNVCIAGLIAAYSFYVREYLALLTISGLAYYLFYIRKDFWWTAKTIFAFFTVFTLAYLMWPIRNYISTGRVVLVKTVTTGYHRYGEDIVSARAWIYLWSQDAGPYLDVMADPDAIVDFPAHIFSTPQDREKAFEAIQLARKCGSGFHHWNSYEVLPREKSCNDEIVAKFNDLIVSYRNAFPLKYYFDIPLQNLQKALFKNQLAGQDFKPVVFFLFAYRTFLLLLAIAGLFLSFWNKHSIALLVFIGAIYVMICFFFRQVEMRYLLQADIASLFLISIFIAKVLELVKGRGKRIQQIELQNN